MFHFADKYGPPAISPATKCCLFFLALRDQSLHSRTGEGLQGKKELWEKVPSTQPWGQAWTSTQAGLQAGSSHCEMVLSRWQLIYPELTGQ